LPRTGNRLEWFNRPMKNECCWRLVVPVQVAKLGIVRSFSRKTTVSLMFCDSATLTLRA
jgi:hypothetical protein